MNHRDYILVANRYLETKKPWKAAEGWQRGALLWVFWGEMQIREGWARVLHSAVNHCFEGFCGWHGEAEEPGLRRGGFKVGLE